MLLSQESAGAGRKCESKGTKEQLRRSGPHWFATGWADEEHFMKLPSSFLALEGHTVALTTQFTQLNSFLALNHGAPPMPNLALDCCREGVPVKLLDELTKLLELLLVKFPF
jgi:hypothetical protein